MSPSHKKLATAGAMDEGPSFRLNLACNEVSSK